MADLTAKTPTPAPSPIPASVPVGPMDAPGTEGGAAPASGFEDDEQQGYPVDGLPAQPPGPPPQPGWVYDPSRGWLSPEVAKEVGFVPSVPTALETSDLPGTESLPTGTVIGDPSAETVTMVTDTGKKVDIPQSTFRGIAEATNPESQLLLMKQAGVLGAEAKILPGGRYIPSQVAKKVAEQSVELERWERDVLPTMPEEYQDAYRSGDTAKVERLAAQYQADYNKWASQFTPKELEEIQSGRYQVLDFGTNRFVAVPKALYEERERQYEQLPEAGTSPGKVSLPEAIEARQELIDTTLSELRAGGFEQPPTTREEYPKGGAPFESYETAPPVYDLVGALGAGYDRAKLSQVFGEQAIRSSESVLADIRLLEKYGSLEAMLAGNAASIAAAKRLQEVPKTSYGEEILPRDLTAPTVTPAFVLGEVRPEKTWESVRTGEIITQTELRERYPKGYEAGLDEWHLSRESGIRLMKDIGTSIKGAVMRFPEDVQLVAKMRAIRNSDPNGFWDYQNPKTGKLETITTAQRDKIISNYESAPFGQKPSGGHPFDRITVHMNPDEKRALLEVGLAAVSIPLATVSIPSMSIAGVSLIPKLGVGILNQVIHAGISMPKFFPAYLTAAAITEGAKGAYLERKWDNFQALPAERQDYWAKLAGYKDFSNLNDMQKASVLLRYQVPSSVTLREWTGGIGKVLEGAQGRVQQLNQFYADHIPSPVGSYGASFLTWMLEAAFIEAPAYIYAVIPMTIAEVADQAPEGKAGEYAMATALAFWMFARNAPADMWKDPTRVGYYFGLLLGPKATAKGLVKVMTGAEDVATMGRLAMQSLADQADVGRLRRPTPKTTEAVTFPMANLVKLSEGMTFTQLQQLIQGAIYRSVFSDKVYRGEAALRQMNVEATYAPQRVTVSIPEVGKALYYKTALQQVLMQTLLSATPEVSKFAIDPAKGYVAVKPGMFLWLSPQLAQTFMASGIPKSPGALGIRLSFNDLEWELPNSVRKILDKPAETQSEAKSIVKDARAEMERLLKEGKLEPDRFYGLFKEYGGQIRLNERGEPYWKVEPIVEVEVVATPGTKLYFTKPNRWMPSTFSFDKITYRKVVTPVSELRIDTPTSVREIGGVISGDRFDANGKLIDTAKPTIHPTLGGKIRRRITAVVKGNSATNYRTGQVGVSPAAYDIVVQLVRDGKLKRGDKIMLVTDRTEPRGYYDLPGGGMSYADLFPSALKAGKRYGKAAFARAEVTPETGIRVDVKGSQSLPAYLGKVNRHALPGSYVELMRAQNTRFKLGKELTDAIWWEVNPSNLRIHGRTPAELITARDIGYYKPESLSVGGVKNVTENIPYKAGTEKVDFHTAVGETRSWIDQPPIEGYGVRGGQVVPIVWLRTARARAEGLGAPSLTQLIGIKLTSPFTNTFKKLFLKTVERRMADEGELATTTAEGYQSMQLRSYRRVVRDMLKAAGVEQTKIKGLDKLDKAKNPKEAARATDRIIDEVEALLPVRGERIWASLALTLEQPLATKPEREVLAAATDRLYTALDEEPISPITGELRPEVAPERPPRPTIEPVPETTMERITEPTPEIPTEGVPERPAEPVEPERPEEPTRPEGPERPEEPTRPEEPERPEEPTRPEGPERPETPLEPPPTTFIRLGAEIVGDKARLPEGSIAWRQGLFWKWIAPTDITQVSGIRKPRNLPRGVVPIGARFTDLRKPTETIQMIGDPGASVPDVAVDLGVADIFISDQAQTIRYAGKGEQTNVGELVNSPTMGMTIGGAGISRPAMTDYYPPKSVSRPAIAKTSKEPVLGGGVREIRSEKDRPYIEKRTDDLLAGREPELVEPLTSREDDLSDLVSLTEEDMSDIFGVDVERDIMGDGNRRKPVNRVRHKRELPRHGNDNMTTLRGLRL